MLIFFAKYIILDWILYCHCKTYNEHIGSIGTLPCWRIICCEFSSCLLSHWCFSPELGHSLFMWFFLIFKSFEKYRNVTCCDCQFWNLKFKIHILISKLLFHLFPKGFQKIIKLFLIGFICEEESPLLERDGNQLCTQCPQHRHHCHSKISLPLSWPLDLGWILKETGTRNILLENKFELQQRLTKVIRINSSISGLGCWRHKGMYFETNSDCRLVNCWKTYLKWLIGGVRPIIGTASIPPREGC